MNPYGIALIRASLAEQQPPKPPQNIDWAQTHALAKAHAVTALMADAVRRLPPADQPPPAFRQAFETGRLAAIAKDQHQRNAQARLQAAFEEQQIHHVVLKGQALKQLYPQPYHREMADIDVLIHPEDAPRVKRLLVQDGYQCQSYGQSHHDIYLKPPFLNIEVHRRALPENDPHQAVFARLLDTAPLVPGTQYAHAPTPETQCVYQVAHLHKHYHQSGSGIRAVLDLWQFWQQAAGTLSRENVTTQLEALGRWAFAETLLQLGDAWFGSGTLAGNRALESVANYVLASGTYGTLRHSVAGEMARETQNGRSFRQVKAQRLARAFFPAAATLRPRYPWLRHGPLLLPLAWILRGVRALGTRPRRVIRMLRQIQAVRAEEAEALKQLYEDSGLD